MRKWTDEKLKAASDANEAVELGLAMLLDIAMRAVALSGCSCIQNSEQGG